MKHVLVLGAGLVSRPLVEYLLSKENIQVTVASRTVSKAEDLIKGFSNGKAVSLNVKNDEMVDELVKDCDIAISLLPYIFHVKIAKVCLKHKKNLVTTSYVSDAMKALDEEAKEAGILILNEIGLDPGIDHMSAMKIIDDVKKNNGKVISFRSFCGGLPAMQNNNNPFGYKFSWSPRGVVMAGKNNGQFLEDGNIVYIPSRDLFKNYEILDIENVGVFEAYTNRNAVPYKEIYGLDDAQTVFRGTLRNTGWCYTMKKVAELGIFDDSPRDDLKGLTYAQMVERLIDWEDSFDIVEDAAHFLNLEPHSSVIKRLEWLGLFSDKMLPDENNVMDMFCHLLLEKLSMDEGDLDLIVLYHNFIAEYSDRCEVITSTLVDTGIPSGDSAMSRTVSLPAAIATALILDKKINLTGVHIPVVPEIYEPVLEELEKMNIKFVEKAIKI